MGYAARTCLKCVSCGEVLSGGLDTYGDRGQEICFNCLCALEKEMNDPMWAIREGSFLERGLEPLDGNTEIIHRNGKDYERVVLHRWEFCPECNEEIEVYCHSIEWTWSDSRQIMIHQCFSSWEGYCDKCDHFTDGESIWGGD